MYKMYKPRPVETTQSVLSDQKMIIRPSLCPHHLVTGPKIPSSTLENNGNPSERAAPYHEPPIASLLALISTEHEIGECNVRNHRALLAVPNRSG